MDNTVLNMLSVINARSFDVLKMVAGFTLATESFDDVESLDELYRAGWVDGIEDGDSCRWVMTKQGTNLYRFIDTLVI